MAGEVGKGDFFHDQQNCNCWFLSECKKRLPSELPFVSPLFFFFNECLFYFILFFIYFFTFELLNFYMDVPDG